MECAVSAFHVAVMLSGISLTPGAAQGVVQGKLPASTAPVPGWVTPVLFHSSFAATSLLLSPRGF